MKRKEGSKQSKGVPGLQIAENQNLGLPKTDRRSNFLYFSISISHSIDTCKCICYMKMYVGSIKTFCQIIFDKMYHEILNFVFSARLLLNLLFIKKFRRNNHVSFNAKWKI